MPSYKRTLELDYDERPAAPEPTSTMPVPSSSNEYCNTSPIYPNDDFSTSGRPHTTTFDRRPDRYRPNIPSKYELGGGGQQGHRDKRVRHSTPHTEATANLASHYLLPPQPPSSGIRPPPTIGTKLPKFFSRPLTCWFWYNGTCTKATESCIYAHWDTGLVAEPPIKIGSGGEGVAGPDASKAVGDGLELRKHLFEKEERLKKREESVKKREERVRDKDERLRERERRLDKDLDRVRGRENDLVDRENDLMDRERKLGEKERRYR